MKLYEPVTQSFIINFSYPSATEWIDDRKHAVIVAENEEDAVMLLKAHYKKLGITELKVLKVESKDLAIGVQAIFSTR
jgi:hypothetical protein